MDSSYLPKSVCVLRLSALGDCINAFGMILGIKKAYPKTKISWIIDERFAPLFIDHDREELVPLYTVNFKKDGFKAIKRLKRELDGKSFDCLLDIQTSIKASLTSLVVNANVKMGYDKKRAREGQSFFVDVKVPSPSDPHVLAGFMAFAHEAGFVKAKPYWDFNLQDTELEAAISCFESNKIFLISPCASKPQKNWTIEGYIGMARYALEHGFSVGLVGSNSPKELKICNAIETALANPNKVINFCGKTTLRQLLSLVAISSLVLAPDSGTLHLANALNVPVIGLYAIHSEKRVGPTRFMDLCVSVHDTIAKEELGDKKIPWRYRVRNEHAMERITLEMVKKAFDTALNNHVVKRTLEVAKGLENDL